MVFSLSLANEGLPITRTREAEVPYNSLNKTKFLETCHDGLNNDLTP